MNKKIFSDLSIKKQTNFNIPDCERVELNNIPQGDDFDLAELMNIWTPSVFYQTLAYPKLKTQFSSASDLNFLIVGDSFVWGLLRNIEDAKLLKDYNFYYYFNTDYGYNKSVKTIDKENISRLKEEILKHKVILLENNEAGLSLGDFGFLDASIKALSE